MGERAEGAANPVVFAVAKYFLDVIRERIGSIAWPLKEQTMFREEWRAGKNCCAHVHAGDFRPLLPACLSAYVRSCLNSNNHKSICCE